MLSFFIFNQIATSMFGFTFVSIHNSTTYSDKRWFIISSCLISTIDQSWWNKGGCISENTASDIKKFNQINCPNSNLFLVWTLNRYLYQGRFREELSMIKKNGEDSFKCILGLQLTLQNMY